MTKKKILMAVLAHPDDETFGMGGTLALYARQNVDTYLLCATRGEVGEMDDKYMQGFNTPAERRESELRCAAGTLGIKGVYFLGYRDSGMPGTPENQHPQALINAPLEEVAAMIAHHIREQKPQVVVTFDPIGGYRHPDHIHIHQATVRAFELANDPNLSDLGGLAPYQVQRLFFQVIPRGFIRAGVFAMRLFGRDPRKFGQNGDIDLVSIAEVSFPVHAVVNFSSVASVRDEAARCHASQGGADQSRGIQTVLRRLIASNSEQYMQAYPPITGRTRKSRDLFAGVRLEE
jgi:N-acetyl-1-D-myo-inositol-2-amino-2-deoxy-alpha-D-glucopyranoside deacetylase